MSWLEIMVRLEVTSSPPTADSAKPRLTGHVRTFMEGRAVGDASVKAAASAGDVGGLVLRTEEPKARAPEGMRTALVGRTTELLALLLQHLPEDGRLTEVRLEGLFTASHLAPSLLYHAAPSLRRLRLFSLARAPASQPPNLPLWAALRPAANLESLSFCVVGLRPTDQLLRHGLQAKPRLEFLGLSDVETVTPQGLLAAIGGAKAEGLRRTSLVYGRIGELYALLDGGKAGKWAGVFGAVERCLAVVPETESGCLLAAVHPRLRELRVVAGKGHGARAAAADAARIAGGFLRFHARDSQPSHLTLSLDLDFPRHLYHQVVTETRRELVRSAGGRKTKEVPLGAPVEPSEGAPLVAVLRAKREHASVSLHKLSFH